jgi:DNA ligase-1
LPIDRRTCKHLRAYRGEEAERQRLGTSLRPGTSPKPTEVEKASKTTPKLLLAESWDNATDLSGWWLSEKLDGVRAYWDGRRFLSRQGNVYQAPQWFTSALPSVPLDGELWLGRKAFQQTISIVRRADAGDLWKKIRYLVFDAPEASGEFEERQKELLELVGARHDGIYASVLEQVRCTSTEDLRERLAQVVALGGEGLMLRQPFSPYVSGRSSTLLKVKIFHDAEACVIEHLAGKGRHKGRLGAVLVGLPNGLTFAVGSGFTDEQRRNPPPIGSFITYRYQELTDRGIPRFPTFVRCA